MFNVALKSSAGSGKTYELAKRYLSLYLREVPLERLYGITFTNKATLEMKERIIHYLEILTHGNPTRPDELKIMEEFSAERRTVEKRRKYLLENLSSMNISTFDSLFSTFLSTLPFEAGILPGYEIIDEIQEAVLLDEILDRFFEEARDNDDYRKAIMELVQNDERRVKEQIANIYRYARKDIEFIKSSFGTLEKIDKDINENKERFRSRLNELIDFINRNETCYWTRSGVPNRNMIGFVDRLNQLLNDENWQEVGLMLAGKGFLSKQYFKNFIENLGTRKDLFYSVVEDLMESYRYFFISLSDRELFVHINPILDIDRLLSEQKLRNNFITFDDIEKLTEEALRCGTDYLYFKIGGSIDHLMIDEFQDTSIRQWEILKPIITEITSYSGEEKTLFYVGDPNQALYRWREGEPRLFEFIKREYQDKIIEMKLDLNYRSKTTIVDFVNKLFDRNDRAEESNWGGWVCIESVGEFKSEEGRELVRKRTVELIEELKEKGYNYNDIAILVRRNSFGVAMTDLLEKEGIPCVSESKAGIFSRDDTRTVLHLLKFLEYPEDDFSLVEVLLSPFFGFDEAFIRSIKRADKSLYLSLIDKYPDSKTSGKLMKLLSMVGFLSPYEIVYNIYNEFNLPMTSSLASMLGAALSYTNEGTGSLSDFIGWLELTGENISVEEGAEKGVRILTIHKAKGLEFPVVVLPDTVWKIQEESRLLLYEYKESDIRPCKIYWSGYGKLFPDVKESSLRRVWEDEEKVLYVAVTRAIEGLYILGFGAKGRNIFNFIKEMFGSHYSSGEVVVKEERKEIEAVVKKRKYRGPAKVHEERELYSPTERGLEVISPLRKEKMELGDVVHKALSRLEWLDGEDVDTSVDVLINYIRSFYVRKPKDEDMMVDVRKILYNTLTQPEFTFAFKKNGRDIRLKVEIPIYFERKTRDISIKIDRLLIERHLVTIIDYKTGEEKEDDLRQLRLYKEGVGVIFPDRRVDAYLLYLEKGMVKRV